MSKRKIFRKVFPYFACGNFYDFHYMNFISLFCIVVSCLLIGSNGTGNRRVTISTGQVNPEIYYVYLNDFERYKDSLGPHVHTIRHKLSWLQAVTVEATPRQYALLQEEVFIDTVIKMYTVKKGITTENLPVKTGPKPKWDTLLAQQSRLMELELLEQSRLTGKGVRIAILDAGFKYVDRHPAFKHLSEGKQIIATRDFYQQDENVYHHSQHGTQVLGCLAGKYEDKWMGVAYEASFLLARTEHVLWEKPQEEDHWIAALEWAYDQGAKIVCSSLSFTTKRDSFQLMDGRTHPVSIAAAKAAEKGMLIVVSMGNEGNRSRKYMGAPADVPSVVSVGGSLPMIPMHIPFSSVGPNALDEVKPNVSAPAYVLTTKGSSGFGIKAGTSFACPMVAGVAACLMQADSSKSAIQIKNMLETSGHYYPYYDYYLGYGVPQVSKLLEQEGPVRDSTFSVFYSGDTVVVNIHSSKDSISDAGDNQGKVIHYHLENSQGYLDWAFYDLIPFDAKTYGFIPPTAKGTLRIWFENYLYKKQLSGISQ